MAAIAGVSESTVYKYIAKLSEVKSDQSFLSIISKRGRPTKYDPVVDAAFMVWLEDPARTFADKLKNTLPERYRSISRDLEKTVPASSDEALMKHCERLYKRLGYSVRKPKLVEAKRCAIWDTLVSWYKDKGIKEAVDSASPHLIFNLDETHINVQGRSPGKALYKKGQRPVIATDVRSSTHVTLVPVVSASGKMIEPVPVIHGPPDTFVHKKDIVPDLALYRSNKGYMDKKTFYKIMVEVFIPYAKKQRVLIGEIDPLTKEKRRIVLFVDGHKSRYYAETFEELRKENIYLIILPAHSSHVTQPLDLRLNAEIKNKFYKIWSRGRGRNYLKTQVRSRDEIPENLEPPKKRGRKKKQRPSLSLDARSEDDFRPIEPVLVSGAEFDRCAYLLAINSAVYSLEPMLITESWAQSHLFPFVDEPPTSKESQDDLERQIRFSDTVRRRRKRQPETIPLTGIVNSLSDQRLLNQLREDLKIRPVQTDKLVTYETKKQDKVTLTVSRRDRDADVGDRAAVLRNGKEATLSCDSDAVFVVTVE